MSHFEQSLLLDKKQIMAYLIQNNFKFMSRLATFKSSLKILCITLYFFVLNLSLFFSY
jgi:hypothetical protein